MKISTLKILSKDIHNANNLQDIIDLLDCTFHYETGKRWNLYKDKMINFIDDNLQGIAPFNVFIDDGNSKLPFLSYSTMPDITCPGAGTCLEFCYSYKGYRYPVVYFRQIQNYLLERFNPELIKSEFVRQINRRKFKKLDSIDFRLFVDGDFQNMDSIHFWMDMIRENPQVKAYGYSKSLSLFAQYSGKFPENYKLNLSNGSKYDDDGILKQIIKNLPIYRGEFIAVQSIIKSGNKGYKQSVLKSLGTKAFVCPGYCGTCTIANGHACGSDKFKNIPIALGIH